MHAAKNVILAGVKAVVLHDTTDCQLHDLAAHFYLSEQDVGSNRATACQEKLQELNTSVSVAASSSDLDESFLSQFQVGNQLFIMMKLDAACQIDILYLCLQVVVCTNTLLKEAIVLDDICHRHNIAFIKAETCGVFASVFCDFGHEFCVLDVDGRDATSHTS